MHAYSRFVASHHVARTGRMGAQRASYRSAAYGFHARPRSRLARVFAGGVPPFAPGSRSTFSWSLRANPKLHFTQYPKQEGHRATLGGLLAVNLAVFVGWRVAPVMGADFNDSWKATWAQSRHGLGEGRVWTLFTPSLSHQ